MQSLQRLPSRCHQAAAIDFRRKGCCMKNQLPAKLEPSQVTAIVDTREQLPLNLSPLKTELGTLATGDYSLKGLEHHVCIERKSLDDLLGCVGRDRERFKREVQRMLSYPVRVLLVEATWGEIDLGQWRSKVTATQATGSLIGWAAMGIQVAMIGSHERAGTFAARLLFTIARRRYAELRQFSETIDVKELRA
jgi:DNA excision repair protein ERCC-4